MLLPERVCPGAAVCRGRKAWETVAKQPNGIRTDKFNCVRNGLGCSIEITKYRSLSKMKMYLAHGGLGSGAVSAVAGDREDGWIRLLGFFLGFVILNEDRKYSGTHKAQMTRC